MLYKTGESMKPVLRFLSTGDIHAHKFSQFATTTKSGMNSRLANCLMVFDIIKRECRERGIDKVLLNGDTLHEADEIDTETYDAVYSKIEELHDAGIQIVLSRGNHDTLLSQEDRTIHALRPFRQIASVVETSGIYWDH